MSVKALEGNPKDILREASLNVSITLAAWGEDMKVFHIGRTHDLKERKSQLGCDHFQPIYAASNLTDAKEVETRLLKEFASDPRCDSSIEDSRGGTSSGKQYVYLAIWLNILEKSARQYGLG
jgi:hypothetical protein